MMAPSSPAANPFLAKHFFFVESGPVRFGAGIVHFRFVFNEFGPHVEMQEGAKWLNLSDYTHYGLTPEDIPHLTHQDLFDLAELFERSVKTFGSGTRFLTGYIPPTVSA